MSTLSSEVLSLKKIGAKAKHFSPQFPAGRAARLGSDDDLASRQQVADGLGRVIFITYRNSRREISERRISVVHLAESSRGERLLRADCHERRALRSFRLDRIEEAIDLETGEVIQHAAVVARISSFLLNPEEPEDAALYRTRYGVKILSFLAICDGYRHPREVEVILDYVCDCCPDIPIRVENLIPRVKGLVPDLSQFYEAIDAMIQSASDRERARLMRYAIKLIEADGFITNEEHSYAQELQNEIRE